MKFDVYGVGNAITDIQARISDELLEKIGFTKGVMTLVESEKQGHVLASLEGHPVNRCAGGSASNTIAGIADFGGTAAYAGKLADDEIGRFWLSDMQALGVTVDTPLGTGVSGTSVILITEDAQRTMLTHLGISATLGPEDLSEEQIAASQYVYVEGYLFTGESTRAAAYRAIELAKKHQVKVAFTVSDPFLIHLFRDEFLKLIAGPVDLLFCNLEEARSLTGKTEPVDCAQQLHHLAADVALTLGGDGSLILRDNQVIPIEATPVRPIDTTGAGDMYAAGILYGLTNGLSYRQAGHLASQAAGRVVSQLGARLSRKFTPQEVARFASL